MKKLEKYIIEENKNDVSDMTDYSIRFDKEYNEENCVYKGYNNKKTSKFNTVSFNKTSLKSSTIISSNKNNKHCDYIEVLSQSGNRTIHLTTNQTGQSTQIDSYLTNNNNFFKESNKSLDKTSLNSNIALKTNFIITKLGKKTFHKILIHLTYNDIIKLSKIRNKNLIRSLRYSTTQREMFRIKALSNTSNTTISQSNQTTPIIDQLKSISPWSDIIIPNRIKLKLHFDIFNLQRHDEVIEADRFGLTVAVSIKIVDLKERGINQLTELMTRVSDDDDFDFDENPAPTIASSKPTVLNTIEDLFKLSTILLILNEHY